MIDKEILEFLDKQGFKYEQFVFARGIPNSTTCKLIFVLEGTRKQQTAHIIEYSVKLTPADAEETCKQLPSKFTT